MHNRSEEKKEARLSGRVSESAIQFIREEARKVGLSQGDYITAACYFFAANSIYKCPHCKTAHAVGDNETIEKMPYLSYDGICRSCGKDMEPTPKP